jgi:hypothetical protein
MNRKIVWALVALLALGASGLRAWMINEDYQQRDRRAATDFHIFLEGDVRGQITGGGRSNVTNPFPTPTVTTSLTAIGNTQVTFQGSGSIAQNLTANRHFGLFGTGTKPRIRLKSWSYADNPFLIPVPVASLDFNAAAVAKVAFKTDTTSKAVPVALSISNLTDTPIAISEAGYLVSPTERPIDDLSRGTLPPSAFVPLPGLDRTLAPGESATYPLDSPIDPSQYVISYATVAFDDPGLSQPYDQDGIGTGGEWAQVAVADLIGAGSPPPPGPTPGPTPAPSPAPGPPPPAPQTAPRAALAFGGIVLAGGLALFRRKSWPFLVLALLFLPAPGAAWVRGNHAGRWTRGATLTIAVDAPPGTAAEQAARYEALAEAVAEWNDAQRPFGGLTLQVATGTPPARPDIHIAWFNDRNESTAPGGPPVEVHIGYQGLDARGVTRVLKHELGHAEGLGHSALSNLMRIDAYSSRPGRAPSDADLNSAGAFISPTADDIAGKRALWGTKARAAAGAVAGAVAVVAVKDQKAVAAPAGVAAGGGYEYDYQLQGLSGPGYDQPIISLAIEVPSGLDATYFTALALPSGWTLAYTEGTVESGGRFDDGESPQTSILSFTAVSPSYGVPPGGSVTFSIQSPLGPGSARAFTSSPAGDADEFSVPAPTAGAPPPPPPSPSPSPAPAPAPAPPPTGATLKPPAR